MTSCLREASLFLKPSGQGGVSEHTYRHTDTYTQTEELPVSIK